MIDVRLTIHTNKLHSGAHFGIVFILFSFLPSSRKQTAKTERNFCLFTRKRCGINRVEVGIQLDGKRLWRRDPDVIFLNWHKEQSGLEGDLIVEVKGQCSTKLLNALVLCDFTATIMESMSTTLAPSTVKQRNYP